MQCIFYFRVHDTVSSQTSSMHWSSEGTLLGDYAGFKVLSTKDYPSLFIEDDNELTKYNYYLNKL